MLHRSVLALVLSVLLAAPARADEVPDGDRLRGLLAAYDRQGGGNTIPIEKEILALREAGGAEALAGHLGHRRFGATVAWALSAGADQSMAGRIVAAVGAWNEREQGLAAATLGRLPGDGGRALLRKMAAREDLPGWARPLVQGALLGAADPDTLASVKADLAAQEPDVVVQALLTISFSHDPAWLPTLSKLLEDERPPAQKLRSHFKVRSTKEGPNGTIHMAVSPELETVGQLALEAANRVVLSDTPEMIAWWYELEKGPRFGFGAAGMKKLRHYVACDAKARRRHLPNASTAVSSVLTEIRRMNANAKDFVLESIDVGPRGWRIEAQVGPDFVEASVDAMGTVALD